MTLAVLAYFAGALTILSPCILPALPFVFARAGQPFLRGTLPMLVGMALTLALVASLDALGGGWAAEATEYGRLAAMIILAGFGIILLFPAIVERVTRPIVSLGAQNSSAPTESSTIPFTSMSQRMRAATNGASPGAGRSPQNAPI
ncbi:MAG: hypothetical protein BGO05_23155 [Rhizobiales bacterium 63-7]|nr:MAG: hypothetical protein BGO05_23155 [Rhizobiales bacterium 63-7]